MAREEEEEEEKKNILQTINTQLQNPFFMQLSSKMTSFLNYSSHLFDINPANLNRN